MGITGIPETLLVAPNGHVIWRWNAPLTQDIIQKDLMPLIERLKDAK